MVEDSRAFPLQQGSLDWLCSLYATINLCHRHDRIVAPAEADVLFRKLVADALPALNWDIGRYITQGVDPNPDVIDLLKAAGFSEIGTLQPTLSAIAEACRETPGVLIYFSEQPEAKRGLPFTHYTIVTSVSGEGKLSLFDSNGFDMIEQVGEQLHADGRAITISAAWRVAA